MNHLRNTAARMLTLDGFPSIAEDLLNGEKLSNITQALEDCEDMLDTSEDFAAHRRATRIIDRLWLAESFERFGHGGL